MSYNLSINNCWKKILLSYTWNVWWLKHTACVCNLWPHLCMQCVQSCPKQGMTMWHCCAHSCNENIKMFNRWLTNLSTSCLCVQLNVTHGRCQCGDAQSAEHVAFVADGPQRNHVHIALRRTRQDGHVTQWYGWDFLPWSCGGQFTLPVREERHNVTSAGKDAAGAWEPADALGQ